MSDTHALLLVVALLAAAGCTSKAGRNCERTADCAEGEFCRMGFCVPAVASDDAAVGDAESNPRRPRRDGDGGRSEPLDARDAETESKPACRGRTPSTDDVVINEILIDVPSGPTGDANGDGERDASADEFVELVNRSGARLDLSGTSLLEGGDERATVGDVCLADGAALVVFGGGDASGLTDGDGDGIFRVADSRLGLSNSGGALLLRGPDGTELAEVEWSDPPSESLTLDPEITGSTRRPHSDLASGRKLSPGTCADGTPLSDGCPSSETSDVSDAGDVETSGDGVDDAQ